jgi:hypothetical protein
MSKVGEGGLHEDHVRALGDVEVDLAHGFAEVGAVHLVAAAVAELRGGAGGLAEGAVESGGELGGVAEDGRGVARRGVEGGADGFDAAVHHVAGCNDVGSGLGEGDGGAGEQGEGCVVLDFVEVCIFRAAGAVAGDNSAVAVRGVLAEADVGDEDEGVEGAVALEGMQTLLHDPIF